MNSQTLVFEVNRCDNASYPSGTADDQMCHKNNEIDAYVNNITVETWANYYKIDFSHDNERPVQRVEDWIRTDRFKAGIVKSNNF